MNKNEINISNKNILNYEPGFIKNNRIKCYKMLNDDIIFQEKKLQRKLKREKMYNIQENINALSINNENSLNIDKSIEFNDKNSQIVEIVSNSDNVEAQNNLGEIKSFKREYIHGLNFNESIKEKINIGGNKNLFVYHKKDKWVASPNSDCILVEKYSYFDNINNNDYKEQKILNSHKNKSYIKSVKLSLAENILYFLNIDNYIIFYKYDIQRKNFNYISEYFIKYNLVLNDYIIEQNEIFCFIFYDNYKMIILDYEMNNELLNLELDFLKINEFKNIKLNKFTEHRIEFCIYSNENFATYSLDTKKLKLNEVINKIEIDNKKIICLDYLPPVSDGILLCLIVCFNNGKIFIINLDFQNILQKYKINYNVHDIIISPFYINFIGENKLIFYNIPNLRIIKFHDIQDMNLLNDKYKKEINYHSQIISYGLDTNANNGFGLIFTEKGTLYIFSYKENKKIKLNNYIPEEQYISQCVLIKNNNNENINNNIYYLLTSHNNGLLKIYEIPTYEIKYEFQLENDEITFLIQIPNTLYFLVFSKNGFVRCFDIVKARSTGKLRIIDIISKDRYSTIPSNYITYIKKAEFYPSGKFFIGVESYNNNLIIFTIDNLEPFSLKCKQIPYIQINALKDILLNNIEPYQTFLITNNNNEIFVYERKYSALITTFDLENDTPIYQKKDYLDNKIFDCNENESLLLNKNKINQNTCFYGFNTSHRERHYLYIFNYKSNSFILRDTKANKTLNIIKLNEPIYYLTFLKNFQNYFVFINKEKIKISNIYKNEIIHNYENDIVSMKNTNDLDNLVLSKDDNIILLINDICFITFSVR